MPSTAIKELLKKAKSAIDDKDFSSVLKICRDVLKTEKQNYHALVFVGVATAAQGDAEKATQAYQRAIKLRPRLALAYKGLIDALAGSTEPEQRLISARAHRELCRNLPQYADTSLPAAANIFFFLAMEDVSLSAESIDAMEAYLRHNLNLSDEERAQTIYRIAKLSLKSQYPRSDCRGEDLLDALETSPLSEALDEYEKLLAFSPRPPHESDVSQFVEKRALLRCEHDRKFEYNYDVLRRARAYEIMLEVAELDKASMISAEERTSFAMRHFHLCPFSKIQTRSRYILAAELYHKTGNLDVASRVSRVDAAVKTGHTGKTAKLPMRSCTHALVNAFFHLLRGEYKIAFSVASEGKSIASLVTKRRRCNAFFDLLRAAALRGDRKFKESLKCYDTARLFGQQEGHSWIESASHQGIVKTSVLAYGRRSRQASTAVEEAAGASSNIFGLLECAWTDALNGEIDVIRMEQLVEEATNQATNARARDMSQWECSLLNGKFVKSIHEIAATGKTRLGQAVVSDTGASPDGLEMAKKLQMDAATMFKGLPDSFAHLGYILELFSKQNSNDKMLSRAIRCYEKAVSFDPSHAVASRRLSQLLLRHGRVRDASLIARYASEKNPRARWAHNVTGWIWFLDNRPIEAAVSFRDALRGRPKMSFKEEEVTFGTNIGQSDYDNPLVIDVDSWRGLCAAYKKMGKLGPALACLDDAIALAKNPPKPYVTNPAVNILKIQKDLGLVLEAERALLLISRRTSTVPPTAQGSLRNSICPLALIQYSLSDALVEIAAEQWMQGCYSRATNLRKKAAVLMESSLMRQSDESPHLNPTSGLKALGDVQMEVATNGPSALSHLLQDSSICVALENAVIAYARGLHVSPWHSQERLQDLFAALSRKAQAKQDGELARHVVNISAATNFDPALTTILLLEARSMVPDRSRLPMNNVTRKLLLTSHADKVRVELGTAMSCYGREINIDSVTDSAVQAIRQNPVDWRGWYAVGKVREHDNSEKNWSREKAGSCAKAYLEADRLGGGPQAVAGHLRCTTSLLDKAMEENPDEVETLYLEASLGASNAARIGTRESTLFSSLIDRQRCRVESRATDMFGESDFEKSSDSESTIGFHRKFHIFPFLDAAVRAFRLIHDRVI